MTGVFIEALSILLQILHYLVLARVILSWFPTATENKIFKIIHQLTEPLLEPIRSIMNRFMKGQLQMLDLSPLVLILIIYILINILRSLRAPGYMY